MRNKIILEVTNELTIEEEINLEIDINPKNHLTPERDPDNRLLLKFIDY